MRRCPKCGFPLNEKDKYCENCGEDCSAVEDSETAETVSLNEPKKRAKRKAEKAMENCRHSIWSFCTCVCRNTCVGFVCAA